MQLLHHALDVLIDDLHLLETILALGEIFDVLVDLKHELEIVVENLLSVFGKCDVVELLDSQDIFLALLMDLGSFLIESFFEFLNFSVPIDLLHI